MRDLNGVYKVKVIQAQGLITGDEPQRRLVRARLGVLDEDVVPYAFIVDLDWMQLYADWVGVKPDENNLDQFKTLLCYLRLAPTMHAEIVTEALPEFRHVIKRYLEPKEYDARVKANEHRVRAPKPPAQRLPWLILDPKGPVDLYGRRVAYDEDVVLYRAVREYVGGAQIIGLQSKCIFQIGEIERPTEDIASIGPEGLRFTSGIKLSRRYAPDIYEHLTTWALGQLESIDPYAAHRLRLNALGVEPRRKPIPRPAPRPEVLCSIELPEYV